MNEIQGLRLLCTHMCLKILAGRYTLVRIVDPREFCLRELDGDDVSGRSITLLSFS